MVSKPEGCTNNSTMKPNPYVSTQNTSSRKPLRQFIETMDVKHKTNIRRFGAAKENRKATKTGNMLWSKISKRLGHTRINRKVIEALYHWILHHLEVVQYPIENDCLYVSIDGNS